MDNVFFLRDYIGNKIEIFVKLFTNVKKLKVEILSNCQPINNS